MPRGTPALEHDPARPLCVHCGERIGVYEPTICLLDGAGRRTSLAAEPDLPERCERLYHAACYERVAAS